MAKGNGKQPSVDYQKKLHHTTSPMIPRISTPSIALKTKHWVTHEGEIVTIHADNGKQHVQIHIDSPTGAYLAQALRLHSRRAGRIAGKGGGILVGGILSGGEHDYKHGIDKDRG